MADYAQTGSLETLTAIMDYHGGLPDEKTARSILRLRYYLEAPALRDLAASHTPGDLEALRELLRQAQTAPEEELPEALFRYHRGVVFLGGNTITPLLFNAFKKVNLEFWSGYIRSVAGRRVCALWPGLRTSSPPDRGTRPPGCWARAWSNSRLLCRSSTFSLRSPPYMI